MPEPSPNPAAPATRDDDASARTSASPRALAATLIALALLPYLSALNAGFVYDDASLVRKHSVVQGDFDALAAATALYWEAREDTQLWRPFVTLSFAVDDALADDSARWMHVGNVFAHIAVTLLGWCFLRRLGSPAPAAFAAAALFAVHPIHTEAVTWISGRAELFAALGVFTAGLAALRRGPGALVLCAAATFFAAASKESAAVLPFFLVALTWLGPRGGAPNFGPSLASAVGLTLYLGARWMVLGSLEGPTANPAENAMVGTTVLERLPTVVDAAGRYVALLVWPRFLVIDYGPPVLGLASGLTVYGLLGSASALALVATVALRRHTRLAIASAFALLFYAVASNLAVVIGTNFAERLFYLPSFGLLWIVAELGSAAAARPQLRRGLSALLVAALAAFALRSFVRNFDYQDELTISAAALAVHPSSPKMLYNHARELNRLGRHEEAVSAAHDALAARPGHPWTAVVLADALIALDREIDAEAELRSFLDAHPFELPPRLRWIALHDARGDFAAGDALAEAAVRVAGNAPPSAKAVMLWARAARAAQNRDAFELATARWEAVVAQTPADAHAWTQLGLSRYALGRTASATSALERAHAQDPNSAQAANALAWLLLEVGDTARALALARNAVALRAAPSYHDTLARALDASGDCNGALEQATLAAASEKDELVAYLRELRTRCVLPQP